jgi:hypothetical protein
MTISTHRPPRGLEANMHAPSPSIHARAARALAIAALACAGVSGVCATALAAGRASVSTGPARAVSYASAVLTGTIDPNGSDTSYYFQYGPTRAYGLQSAIADAGSGIRGVDVSVPISGLQPITQYHYRLVAVNAAGAQVGADHTFLTTKVPLSLQILVAPNPVLFGGTVLVQGTLSGTGNANRPVVLQASGFPFAAGFATVGNPELTTATGGFDFPVLGLTTNTQFRVVTSTTPPVASPVATASVAVRVSSHVGRTHRAHFARIYGTVTPAEDGMHVGILRIVHGRNVLVGGTVLRHRNASSSRFSRVVHVHAGVYRVLVVVSGAQSSNYGQPLAIR